MNDSGRLPTHAHTIPPDADPFVHAIERLSRAGFVFETDSNSWCRGEQSIVRSALKDLCALPRPLVDAAVRLLIEGADAVKVTYEQDEDSAACVVSAVRRTSS